MSHEMLHFLQEPIIGTDYGIMSVWDVHITIEF